MANSINKESNSTLLYEQLQNTILELEDDRCMPRQDMCVVCDSKVFKSMNQTFIVRPEEGVCGKLYGLDIYVDDNFCEHIGKKVAIADKEAYHIFEKGGRFLQKIDPPQCTINSLGQTVYHMPPPLSCEFVDNIDIMIYGKYHKYSR